MGHSQFDDASRERAAWNAGKQVGTKRPLTQKQIWAVRFFLDREHRVRDRALFDLAIDSKLRGCDLVKIRIGDVVAGPEIRTRSIVVQQKTGRPDADRASRSGWPWNIRPGSLAMDQSPVAWSALLTPRGICHHPA